MRGRLPARQHDDLHVRVRDANRLQRFEPVHARHRHVEQHDVGRRVAVQRLQQIGAAGERLDVVAARAQQRLEILDELLVVVDQREPGRRHGCDLSV